jgi:hypothetical protein
MGPHGRPWEPENSSFYANEHERKHVHVVKGDAYAKIELYDLRVVKHYMKPKDLKTAISLLEIHKDEFERQWDDYFSER